MADSDHEDGARIQSYGSRSNKTPVPHAQHPLLLLVAIFVFCLSSCARVASSLTTGDHRLLRKKPDGASYSRSSAVFVAHMETEQGSKAGEDEITGFPERNLISGSSGSVFTAPSEGAHNREPSKDQKFEKDTATSERAAVQFARLCGGLKTTLRTGWVRRGVPNPESVADHSWRVAALCLLLNRGNRGHEKQLNVSKCMEMAIVHDLAESIVGDIAPSDNVPKQEKQRLEDEAIHTIAASLGRAAEIDGIRESTLLSVFEEYERRESDEAIAVKDLDLLDMIVQADEYESANPGIDLGEFFAGTPVSRFRNDYVRRVAAEVHRQREERVQKIKEKGAEKIEERVSSVNGAAPAALHAKNQEEEVNKEDALSVNDAEFAAKFAASSPRYTEDEVANIVKALRRSELDNASN